ncbi:hypothetical protein MPSEU_000125800 [Mayamaea pseudoterrestris]|nr:hypothetical protein MPSEU_000124500 [Mayamaea pseudoterrestris]GKY91537.1 hypothetical protein MPSEU_000125800 [Mayamaea pseudoterrestris]
MKSSPNGSTKKDDLLSPRRRVAFSPSSQQRWRRPLLIGILIGAAMTTCIQSIIWSIRHANESSKSMSSLLMALEESKQKHLRLTRRAAEDSPYRRRRRALPLSRHDESVKKIHTKANNATYNNETVTDESAPDDDDLLKKLRASSVHLQIQHGRVTTSFQQRMAAHQERLRLVREQQQRNVAENYGQSSSSDQAIFVLASRAMEALVRVHK